jgi:phosphohistidine swiveling domain-containing protein
MKLKYSTFFFLTCIIFKLENVIGLSTEVDMSDFYDLSIVKPQDRKANSSIIQFCYTSELNIGDYLPTLAIRKMLFVKPDIWNFQDNHADFNFINKNYKCAIIGGAGLFHKGFEATYVNILENCTIPVIIWGVGICLPNGKVIIKEGVNKKVIANIEKKCDLINVRDELTANYYNLTKALITACPTIAYLQKFRNFVKEDSDLVLYSSHDELVPLEENQKIISAITQNTLNFKMINNLFSKEKKISDIEAMILEYCQSKIVVTTRLHGAIIAYGLGIPYIIIPFDEKLRAFHQKFGNGVIANNLQELKNYLTNHDWIDLQPIKLQPVIQFGNKANNWALKNVFRKYFTLIRALDLLEKK